MEASYLTRGPGEFSGPHLHARPELPSVDAAILPLLHTLGQLDAGLLQVLLHECARGLLLLLLQGLRPVPGVGVKGRGGRTELASGPESENPAVPLLPSPNNAGAEAADTPILQEGKLRQRSR